MFEIVKKVARKSVEFVQNKLGDITVASGTTLVAGQSFAAGVDLTSLTSAVDLSTVIPALLAVGAILMGPRIAKFAISSVQRMFPG